MPLPLADLGSVVLATMGEDIERQRRAPGTYVNGLAAAGALTTSTISASVQPATGAQLQKLPEGERTEETVAVFTAEPLLVSEVGAGSEGDRIVWRGRTYRVRMVEDWTRQARYAFALAVRVSP